MQCHCEFCSILFHPRPQVKKPRACPNCQKQRQRLNEKEWHTRNSHLSSMEYHRIYRQQRLERIAILVEALVQSMNVGFQFFDFNFDKKLAPNLNQFLIQFLNHLGLRQINKFWPDYFSIDLNRLAHIQNMNKLQTS